MIDLPWKSGIRPKILIAIAVVAFITLLVVGEVLLSNSEKCKTAKRYIELNQQVLEVVGSVKGYGLYVTHSVDKDEKHSSIGLCVKGSKENTRVKVYFRKDEKDEWVVEYLRIE